MKCAEAHIGMLASIERGVALDEPTRIHVAECDDCREDFADWTLDHALRTQSAPMPDDDFVDRAVAYAIREAAVRRRRRLSLAASVAFVAVALGLVFGNLRTPPTDAVTTAHVTLTAHEGKTVRVVIDSPAQQNAATVTIELADNLELAGFPNERKIEWQTDLSKGKNLLALPLTLTDDAESHFNVALSHGKTKKDVRVAVHATAPKQAEA
jgi:hypothetical protein